MLAHLCWPPAFPIGVGGFHIRFGGESGGRLPDTMKGLMICFGGAKHRQSW